jgi:hypothetical protein
MSLLDLIKRDANVITKNLADFGESITVINREAQSFPVAGLHTKHHLGFDIETAQEIHTLKAHVCISEQELVAAGCTVRDASNKVDMKDFRVLASDANGVQTKYVVREIFPNDKVGVIVLILGAHEQD